MGTLLDQSPRHLTALVDRVVEALRAHPALILAMRPIDPERLDPLIPRAELLALKLQEARTHDEADDLLRALVGERWDPALAALTSAALLAAAPTTLDAALRLAHLMPELEPTLRAAPHRGISRSSVFCSRGRSMVGTALR